jgi:hypothetical protein
MLRHDHGVRTPGGGGRRIHRARLGGSSRFGPFNSLAGLRLNRNQAAGRWVAAEIRDPCRLEYETVFPADAEANFVSWLQNSFINPLSVYESSILSLVRQAYGSVWFEGKNRMLSRELWVFDDEVLILRAAHPKAIYGNRKLLALVGTVEPEQTRLREGKIQCVALDTEILGNGSATPLTGRHPTLANTARLR